MKIADLDDSTRLLLFRASVVVMHGATPADLVGLKEAKAAWEVAHAEEICANIFRGINDPSIQLAPNEEECDVCEGTGVFDTSGTCPKCKGRWCG